MVRKERTEVMAHAETAFLKKLVAYVTKNHEVQILEEPNSGLVMMKMRESAQKHLFYLGEVFVTECKVMIGDVIGLGILQGAHKKRAQYMAIVDGAYNAGIEEIVHMDRLLESEKQRQKDYRKKEIAQLLKTKVDFETLDEEVKS